MNVGHGSMQIASSMDIYNETTVPRNIVVRGNKRDVPVLRAKVNSRAVAS